jgi:hypothetical protein
LRGSGKVCDDPIADRLLQRIAADENLHMIFYRNMCEAALDLSPDQALDAVGAVVENFRMPGQGMPDFRRNGVLMAKHDRGCAGAGYVPEMDVCSSSTVHGGALWWSRYPMKPGVGRANSPMNPPAAMKMRPVTSRAASLAR